MHGGYDALLWGVVREGGGGGFESLDGSDRVTQWKDTALEELGKGTGKGESTSNESRKSINYQFN